MSDREHILWRAVRRGLLTICAAIERDPSAHVLWVAVRQGLLTIADAIEKECAQTL